MVTIIVNPYKKINWRKDGFKKPWLGHRFWRERGQPIEGDKRCLVCGKWMTWSIKNKAKYIQEGRWDFDRKEPIHCNSEHCQEYWRRYEKAEEQRIKLREEYYLNLYKRLKKLGLVK